MRLRDLTGVALGILAFGLQAFFLASATGIVKEHCLASNAENIHQVESSWTYIIWPPLIFTALDPPGRCVRNTIAREALGKAGIWPLGTPSEQVDAHLRSQAEQSGDELALSLLETGPGDAEGEKQLLLRRFRELIRRLGYPPEVERCVMRAARRLPADQLYNEARDGLNNERISGAMEKAWARCLPAGTPMINPEASEEAIDLNRRLLSVAVTKNMRDAGAPAKDVECVDAAIHEIEREELIELSTDPEQLVTHLESLVLECGR